MFVEIVRLFVVMLGTLAGLWFGRNQSGDTSAVTGIIGCLIGYVSGGVLGRLVERAVGAVEKRVEHVPAAHVLAGLGGGVGGVLVGVAASIPFLVAAPPLISVPVGGLFVWIFAFFGYRIVIKQAEAMFRMVGLSTTPLVRAMPYGQSDGMLVDTSAIMDGQLRPLVQSGFFDMDLMVPRFVLDELQGFADAPDEMKSRRAQRGLEILALLRKEGPGRILTLDQSVPEVEEVDAKLLALAKKLQLKILTTDGNLARNAEVQGISVCNLRKLAQELSPQVVAGERIQLALTKPGKEEGQGVGFLDDGSMVIVNGGADLVGVGTQELVVTSIVPTAMGRLVFARSQDLESVETIEPAH